MTVPRIILLVLMTFAGLGSKAAAEDSTQLDSLYLKGARGIVPCNDGSVIGGYINCPSFQPGSRISDQCTQPMMTRSWDGGRTWEPEAVDAPDHAFSGIVRLRHGVLLSAHNRWLHRFMASSDNGRTWHPTFDSTEADTASNVNITTGYLYRDHRGILFWRLGAGGLFMSLDNGLTRVRLSGAEVREGYYVVAPDGLLVTHTVQAGTSPGSIQLSFDHGRSWSEALTGYSRGSKRDNDSSSTLTGCVIIRDTVVVNDRFGFYPDGGLTYKPRPRTMYWHRGQRSWMEGRYLHSFGIYEVMDSADCWYDGFSVLGINDTVPRYVSRDIPTDSIPPAGDTLIYTRGRLPGLFYDLDGNVHPHGTEVYIPGCAQRPVSRLDRLYTCTGVEYVVGGHHLDSVHLDPSRSVNARLSYTITPNRRLSTIVVEAVDTTRPIHFTMVVDDSIVGRQWFTDSVLIATTPVVEEGRFYLDTILTCTYPDGPFMWYHNDTLMQHPITGAYADSVILKPKPGRYKVMAKSPFGCDVWSNEVSITTTSIGEGDDHDSGQYSAYMDASGTIHVRWPVHVPAPTSVSAFDVLGRQLEADVRFFGQGAVVNTNSHQPVILIVSTHRAVHALMVSTIR